MDIWTGRPYDRYARTYLKTTANHRPMRGSILGKQYPSGCDQLKWNARQSVVDKRVICGRPWIGPLCNELMIRATVGQNQVVLRHRIIYFLTSSGVREGATEWAQRSARAKRAVRSQRMSEWCEQTNERTSEWPSTYVPFLGSFEPL